MNLNVQQFIDWYGEGSNGASPTEQQWRQILTLPENEPVTLINFFKLNETANYPARSDTFETSVSGEEAFNRYAEVSVPTMERVGGKFLHVGPFSGMFIGEEEHWDIVAIGAYPDLHALVSLYSDEGYRAAFIHRTAACARQKVLVATE
ncbi:DUF1330 domain-containing protein [Parasphingorhabdus cellanae]|uniref:DUF1330 domain-containing protein n=1 Tax=Parasphingorhabdus cellanae TaxID=2806553 RepID=A0ABX7TAB5_9SPHN|nr:DUF1330 domain-containing protein [Parasphingorhabdus cellanae]QTD57327.1 DUF1330 domain-containing protein [Parasphingorhabdus cellanae]